MIVSEPFAVSYGMEALLHTMIVDIGAGTTDFCVMRGRYPTEEDQRTLTNAGDSVDEQLATLVRSKHPDARFSIYMVREWKEKWSFVGDPPAPVVVTVQKGAKATPIDITGEMRRACESLLGPICGDDGRPPGAGGARSTRSASATTSSWRAAAPRSPGSPPALERVLVEYGGGAVRVVEDPVFAGSNGSLAIALDASEGDWESLSG